MKSHDHDHHDLQVKKVDRLSSTKVRLTVEFPGESVAAHEKMTAARYAQIAKIPGFRPGKAPMKMVMDKYKDDILKDVLSHLVEAGLAEAIEKTKLMPVNRPSLKFEGRAPGSAQPFEFHAEFEVQPEIELRNYKGVPLKEDSLEVTDDEVVKTLDNIRERLATLEPLEATDPTPGCFAVLEVGYELVDDPSKKEAPKSFTAELGSGKLFPELETALMKMKVGADLQRVEGKFPEDYDDKTLAGKAVKFDCRILDLKTKRLPEVNDTLAAQIRPGSTLEDLKKEIRGNILSSKQEESRRAARAQIVEYLVANHVFDVPNSLVEGQMHRMLQWMADDMRRRGQAMPQLKEEDIGSLRKRAEHMVRSSMLLKEIATKEQISVDEEKLKERLEAISTQVNRSPEETEKLMSGKGMLDQLRDEILTDQVFDFLITNAQRTGSSPRP